MVDFGKVLIYLPGKQYLLTETYIDIIMKKGKNRYKPLIIETRDTMPEIHTNQELFEMAKKIFDKKCDEIEKKYGFND